MPNEYSLMTFPVLNGHLEEARRRLADITADITPVPDTFAPASTPATDELRPAARAPEWRDGVLSLFKARRGDWISSTEMIALTAQHGRVKVGATSMATFLSVLADQGKLETNGKKGKSLRYRFPA